MKIQNLYTMTSRSFWTSTVLLVSMVVSGCSYTKDYGLSGNKNTCDVLGLERLYKEPQFGAKKSGFVADLRSKLERFLLNYDSCNHEFQYEYFIDANYSGKAPGLIVHVSVNYKRNEVAQGCVEDSFSKYCFNARGRLELVSERDDDGQ